MNTKELAEQAGIDQYDFGYMDITKAELDKFAELVAAQMRVRCIDLVLAGTAMPVQTKTLEALQRDRKRIAALIEEDGKP